MHSIGQQPYVQLTTFTVDGRAKPAPVWIVELADGRLGFTTGANTWKVRRVRRTSRVELRACDRAGRVYPEAVCLQGTATIGTSEENEIVHRALIEKYGWQVRLVGAIEYVAALFGQEAFVSDTVIMIEVSAAASSATI